MGWEEGDLQAFIKLGSDDRNFYMYRAPARSTTWEPEFVIDLEVWRRLRARLEAERLNGPAGGGPRRAACPIPTRTWPARGPTWCTRRIPASIRRTSRRSRRSPPASSGRRGLADAHRSGAVGGRHPARHTRSPSWERRCRWTPAWSPATWATCRSPTYGRTASSGRSTRIRATGAPARCSSTPAGSSTGSCPPRSASRCRSTSPTTGPT